MIYNLNEKFTKVEENKGVLENKSIHSAIELVVTDGVPEKDTGIELQPKEKMPFALEDGKNLYARCPDMNHAGANLAVVNFNVPASNAVGAGTLVPKIEKFMTAGTYDWTVPQDGWYKVYVTGGGGGSGSITLNTSASCACRNATSGAGGGGGTAIKQIQLQKGQVVKVVVGKGGIAGKEVFVVNTGIQAGNGGTSSFGSYCSATGGGSGRSLNTNYSRSDHNGLGGAGVGGDFNYFGGQGVTGIHRSQNYGVSADLNVGCVYAAPGGRSYWAEHPRRVIQWDTCNGIAGILGCGASSAKVNMENGTAYGAEGGDGVVVIEWTEVQ